MSVDSSTRGDRRRAALVRGQRLGDRFLVGAGIDRLHLDAGIGLLEIGGIAVDDLGDRSADRDRIEERDLGSPARTIAGRRERAGGQRGRASQKLPSSMVQFSPPVRRNEAVSSANQC